MKLIPKVKATLGVTLLEIMLVLAVASMIIVMSVRYYQSAMANQQANSILQQLQAITAQADILAQATGSYAAADVSMSTLAPLLPGGAANAFVTPWGTTIVIGKPTASTYPITVPVVPTGVCPLVTSKLKQNNHYANVLPTSCAAGSSITYTYEANP